MFECVIRQKPDRSLRTHLFFSCLNVLAEKHFYETRVPGELLNTESQAFSSESRLPVHCFRARNAEVLSAVLWLLAKSWRLDSSLPGQISNKFNSPEFPLDWQSCDSGLTDFSLTDRLYHTYHTRRDFVRFKILAASSWALIVPADVS